MNSFDWLSKLDIVDTDPFDFVEVSFKNGARKAFFRSQAFYRPVSGDMVVVDMGGGFDIGRVMLSGELVRLQMKKRRTNPDNVLYEVIRKANERDLERLQEARELERPTMIQARAIARSLGLDMKIGDVEFQGDKRKATFYYTANGRVDFRELIRQFAKEFRVKIEMRQIGARQESARIGGLGSCGRELCCSTWLTDFKSVSTGAARYQNLAINQSKLSGQCGRLKCCLNFELDTYMEALEAFPEKADRIYTEAGTAVLVKTDIFKQLMFYTYQDGPSRGKLFPLEVRQVWDIQVQNKEGKKPVDLSEIVAAQSVEEEGEPDYEDVTGFIELPPEERKKRKKKRKKGTGNTREEGTASAAPTVRPPQRTPTADQQRATPREERPSSHTTPGHTAPRHERKVKDHRQQRSNTPPASDGPTTPTTPRGDGQGRRQAPPTDTPATPTPRGDGQGRRQTPPQQQNRPDNRNQGPRPEGDGPQGGGPEGASPNRNNKRRRGNRRGKGGGNRPDGGGGGGNNNGGAGE